GGCPLFDAERGGAVDLPLRRHRVELEGGGELRQAEEGRWEAVEDARIGAAGLAGAPGIGGAGDRAEREHAAGCQRRESGAGERRQGPAPAVSAADPAAIADASVAHACSAVNSS